jgi:hypothetical protein
LKFAAAFFEANFAEQVPGSKLLFFNRELPPK